MERKAKKESNAKGSTLIAKNPLLLPSFNLLLSDMVATTGSVIASKSLDVPNTSPTISQSSPNSSSGYILGKIHTVRGHVKIYKSVSDSETGQRPAQLP